MIKAQYRVGNHETACSRTYRLDDVDRGSPRGGVSRLRNARHLAPASRRCGYDAKGGIETVSANPAAQGSRGGADFRRRSMACNHAEGAENAGPGMRTRNLFSDR